MKISKSTPFKATDGHQTVTVWLSEDEIIRGDVSAQVVRKALAKGLNPEAHIKVSLGY